MPNFAHLPNPAAAFAKLPALRRLTLWLLIVSAVLVPVAAARADAESDWRAGFAAGARGEYELALRYYSRVIHAGWLPPGKMAQVFYNRATAYLRLGDLDWAIQDYSVAIWLRPDFADAFYNRGLAHRRNGDQQRSDDDLARAFALGRAPDEAAAAATAAATAATGEPAPDPIAPPPTEPSVAAAPTESRTLALAAEPPARGPPPATGSAGAYALQVAAFRTEAAAAREWRRLKRRLPNLLGDQAMVVRRVALTGRGIYYRVLVGSFADRAAAAEACLPIKAARQNCRPLPIGPGATIGSPGE